MPTNYVESYTSPVPGLREDHQLVFGTVAVQDASAVAITGGTIVNVTAVGKVQSITIAGAIDLDAAHVQITGPGTSTYAVTLAVPTQAGITKVIEMIATTGSNAVTLALTNVVGGTAATTATFDAAGDILILVSASAKWVVVKQQGVVLS